MKKIFTLLMLIAFTGILSASALKPEEPSNFTGKAVKNPDASYSVKLSLNAPVKEYSYDDNPADLEYIDKITITRSCYDLGESNVLVTEFEDPTPGMLYEHEDKNVQKGYTYYYYAVACVDNVNSYQATIYGIYVGIKPKAPSINLSVDEDGMPPVKVNITAPAESTGGDPIAGTMTITVSRTFDGGTPVVKTFENVAPGNPVEYDDEIETLSKNYVYKVKATTEDGISDEVSKSIYVGRDLPSAPKDIKAEAGTDGSVNITWTAPTDGINQGSFLTPVFYKVTRDNDGKVIVEKSEECHATDPCDDLDAPTSLSYSVYAYNSDGGNQNKATGRSNSIIAGPAAGLPFHEGFAAPGYYGGPEMLWSYPDYTWEFTKYYDYNYGIQPYKGAYDDGMAVAYYYSSADPSEEYPMTSCSINFSSALHPVISFFFHPVDCDNQLRIESVTDGETTVAGTLDINKDFDPSFTANDEDPTSGWIKAHVALPSLAGKSMSSIKLVAVGAADPKRNAHVYIDEIDIDDYPYAQPEATVDNAAQTVTLTWSDPSTESRQAQGYTVYVDGKAVHETTATSYIYQGETGKTYKMYVATHYDGYTTHTPEAAQLGVSIDSTSAITAVTLGEGEASVELYNLQGMRVSNPTAGSILIRRATLTDGTVRNNKIIIH